MRAVIESLEVRDGFTIKKGSTIYLNFRGTPSGVISAEVVNIAYDNEQKVDLINAGEEDVDVEVYSGSRFSTYNSNQLRRSAFATRAEAEKVHL